jgi:hypothetical protein
VVTSLSGSAQAQGASGTARTLRLGDEVNQGETVSTGASSSVVLRFDDGQVAALTSNSRMQVTTYQYNAQSNTGSVLLSLISGGMRAVTGLIGRTNPQTVSYKAATATIGIRGTDVTIVTSQGNVVVSVNEGSISFTFGGQTITIPAGQGVNAKVNQAFQAQAAAQIMSQVPADVAAAIGGLQGLTNAINQASGQSGPPPGPPPPGQTGPPPGPPPGTPTGPGGPTGGGGGGGNASKG